MPQQNLSKVSYLKTDESLESVQKKKQEPKKGYYNKYDNRMEDYKKLAIKDDLPRKKGFKPIENPKYNRLINFGKPVTLIVTNPIKLAIDKEKERKAVLQDVKNKTNRIAPSYIASKEPITQDIPEHEALLLRQPPEPYRSESINTETYTALPTAREKRSKTVESRSKFLPENIRDPEPQARLRNESEPRSPQKALQTSNSARVLPKSVALKALKKRLQPDRHDTEAVGAWIAYSERNSQQRKPDGSFDQSNLSLCGKHELNSVYIRGSDPFKDLRPYVVKQLDQTLNKSKSRSKVVSTSESCNQTQRSVKRSQSVTAVNQRLNSNKQNSIVASSSRTQWAEADVTSFDRVAKDYDRTSINLRRSMSTLRATPAMKTRFGLRAVRIREYQNEVNEVKSLLNVKRFGIDK